MEHIWWVIYSSPVWYGSSLACVNLTTVISALCWQPHMVVCCSHFALQQCMWWTVRVVRPDWACWMACLQAAGPPACLLYFENLETHKVTLDHVVYQRLCYRDICEFGYLQNKVGRSDVSWMSRVCILSRYPECLLFHQNPFHICDHRLLKSWDKVNRNSQGEAAWYTVAKNTEL